MSENGWQTNGGGQAVSRRSSGRSVGSAPAAAGDPRRQRVPPHNLVAEESLLGAMLLSRDAIADALETVAAEHFYRPSHRRLFEAIHGLYSAGDPADPVTVSEAMERSDALNRSDALSSVGGLEGLLELQLNTPAISNASSYARIVQENFTLRRLIETAGEIAEMAYARPTDVAAAVDQAENLVYQIAQGQVSDSAQHVDELINQALDHLERLYDSPEDVTGLATGYAELDHLLTGLQPSSLYVVGGRPSMGKTAFALGAAEHAAVETQRPVLVFSLEMGAMEVMLRVLSSRSRVNSSNMRTGRLDMADWDKITRAVERITEAPLWIDDNPNVTVMEIRARARRLRSQLGDLGLVVVDYLQLMTGRHNADNRQVEVAEISRGLKILARELKCPVLALSQLSRSLEMRQNKRPQLSDLRESGAIEQDADVVMFIYRDEMYNPENTDTSGTAEIIVAKNRNGPTATRTLAFLPRFAKFANFAADAPV